MSLKKWKTPEHSLRSSQEIELERTRKQIAESTIKTIGKQWKGKYFEEFMSILLNRIPGVEVNFWGDTGKGWDLLLRIIDPLSGEILHDDVPVQCKNYEGPVETRKPIEDLERCAKNSDSNLIYLVITGDVSNHYMAEISRTEQSLSAELKRNISFKVITEERLAELYLQCGI